jgi:Periplasmic binding protein
VLGIGIVVGLLLAGVAVPFLLADRATTQVVSGPGAAGQSDPGVADTAVKVGFTRPDLTNLKQFNFGYLDSGDVEGRFRALVDAQNAKGGINGRRIDPVFASYDIAADPAAAAQAACTTMVTDQKVFAVIDAGPYPASGVSCYTDAGLPFFTLNGYIEGSYQSGLLFTAFASYERTLREQVAYLNAHHLLDGKTIGVFTDSGSQLRSVQNALVPAVEAAGQKVVDIESVDEDTTALQQLPAVLAGFKSHHVDVVIMATLGPFAKLFPTLAAAQGFTPKFALSDFYNEISDAYGDYGPASNGAIGLTATRAGEAKAGDPIPAADQSCLDRVGSKENLQRDTQPYIIAMYQCALFDVFVASATKAGHTLTHAGLVSSAEQLGSFPVPYSSDGSIGPGKHDIADGLRAVTYDSSCPCWTTSGEPFAVPK